MKKILFFAAVASVALASCMNEEFIGDNSPTSSQGTPGAINFRYDLSKVTREDATGSTAAGHLSKQFIVWGEKNEINAGSTGANVSVTAGVNDTGNSIDRSGHLVFNNYVVDWFDNSAFTTTSNTQGWEYVGLKLDDDDATPATTSYSSHISPFATSTPAQTIKYWDYGASSYTFTAVSALPADISAGNVSITKTTTGSTVYDKGYSVTLNASAHLDNLYFSERVNITPSSNTDRTADNTYGGNVTFRFHNLASKVRVAMYETIPGYSVTINSFKVDDNDDPGFDDMDTEEADNFAANFVNNASGTAGTMTVEYIVSGATQNHPTISFTPTSSAANILELGNQLKENVTIGTTIAGATYDKAEKAYTSVFPKENNTQNLKLKVCYTLTAVDNSGAATTGETITVTDATAEIPANYLKWKPGYAYTYIFKISPNTNGQTGPGTTPTGLYPITFDAIEIVAEDGQAEYITTVSEPSITTFGVNSAGKYLVNGNEYANTNDIYVTIMDGSTDVTPNLGTNVNIYKSVTAAAGYEVTEAALAEAIQEVSAKTHKISYTLDNTIGSAVTTVPGEDGNTKTIHALKLDKSKLPAGTYAVEYIKTAATYKAEEVTYATQAEYDAAFKKVNLYTAYTNHDTKTAAAADSWTSSNKTFYKEVVDNVGVYAYKVIVVQ
jgi:hypothetical protein